MLCRKGSSAADAVMTLPVLQRASAVYLRRRRDASANPAKAVALSGPVANESACALNRAWRLILRPLAHGRGTHARIDEFHCRAKPTGATPGQNHS